MRNITAFRQHLLRLIKSVVLANTDTLVKPKYWAIYRSISTDIGCRWHRDVLPQAIIPYCAHEFIKLWYTYNTLKVWLLTLLEPPGFGNFRKKNSSFRLPYQCPSSSAHCARELFSGSNGSASLVDCTRKKFFCLGVRFFCEWHHKWRTFWPPWPTLPGPGRQLLGGSISLKFLLETRLQSKSFDTLDDLLGFGVPKLWCKLVKIFD